MQIHRQDFGRGLIPLNGDEVLFLDSNMVIAYLDPNHKRHLVAYTFLSYLFANSIPMVVSETVVNEVLFIITKGYWEMIPNPKNGVNFPKWAKAPRNHPMLIRIQRRAKSNFLNVFGGLIYIPTNTRDALRAIDHLADPLLIGDALLLSAAENECTGIVSLDSDLQYGDTLLELYHTDVENPEFMRLAPSLLPQMDVEEYLHIALGDARFFDKYGYIPVSAP